MGRFGWLGFLLAVCPSFINALTIPGPVPGMEFVEIEPDTFEYGRVEEGGIAAKTGDSVWVRSYQMMTTEVTRGMWETVMGVDVSGFPDSSVVIGTGSDHPMTMVSLHDCMAFAESLSAMDTLHLYRVPIDRYWTYAACPGTYAPYSWGEDTLDVMDAHCWYAANSGDSLHPVASRTPNSLGIHDMFGSVWEWTTVAEGVEFQDTETGETVVGQVMRGGSVYAPAGLCRMDIWIPADSGAAYSDVGFRLIRRARSEEPEEDEDTRAAYERLLESHHWDNRFSLFAEPMLAVGGISHDFDDDDIQQFGYDVKGGCEQDAAYLRLGFGKQFGGFGAYAYGEAGHLGPGSLIDNHGPWILPEVLLRMNLLGGGIELRFRGVRARLGYGLYTGTAEIDEDTTGHYSPGSWTTDIEDGTGISYAIGYIAPFSEHWSAGLEWSQHFIDLRLAESGTGVPPSDHSARQSEVRFFANYRLPFNFSDIF